MNQNHPQQKKILSQPRKRKSTTGRTIALAALALATILCLILFFIHFAPSHRTDPEETGTQGTERETQTGVQTETEQPGTDTATETEGTSGRVDPPAPAVYTVVIDPGHGFWDTGCTVDEKNGVYENALAMDIAERMAAVLKAAGVDVIFTHDGKTFPTLNQLNESAKACGFSMETFVRNLVKKYGVDVNGNPVDANTTWKTYSANLSDAGSSGHIFNVYERAYHVNVIGTSRKIDALISIHVNAVNTSDPNVDPEKFGGYTVSYCTSNDHRTESSALQSAVVAALQAKFPAKKLIKYADPWYDSLVILKYTDTAALLVETGYNINPDDKADLLNEEWRQQMAETLAKGYIDYLYGTAAAAGGN